MTTWARSSVLAVAALFGAFASAVAQDIALGGRYRQSADVLARYGDIAVALTAPALAPGRSAATTQEELEAFVRQLASPEAPATLRTLTTTPQGRALPILYLTRERLAEPAAIRATGRPVVWLIGQQHGNEPAGGEALLAVAHELTRGAWRPLLDDLAVVIVPRANPDGAALDKRDTAAGMDLNRDHGSLALPETRALHRAIVELPPDLVIDAHEFSVAQRWIEKFGGLQAVDLMILDATHPMVPEVTAALARGLFEPAVRTAVAAAGLTMFAYHTTSTKRADRSIAMGGNAPGIARNAFGLMGAVSFLIETRGVGIGLEGYQRRVATHVIAIEAMLRTAAREARTLKDTVALARREIATATGRLVIAHAVDTETVSLPLVDPVTADVRTAEVAMTNSRRVAVTTSRERPAGYVLLPDAAGGHDAIRLLGARTCVLKAPAEIDAEMFEVRDRGQADRRAINPEAAVKAQVRPVRVMLPAGAVYVPMAQASAHRVAMALEPDAPGSFVALDVIRVPNDHVTLPIVRVPHGARLGLSPVSIDDAAACGG